MDPQATSFTIDQIRSHIHDGNLSQRINFFDIFGTIPTVSSVPTIAPSDVAGQLQIYDGQLYFYDFANNVWRTSGGVLFDHYVNAGNVTTGETDLYSDTVSNKILLFNGDKLFAEYAGLFVSSGSATRELRVYFAGVLVFDSGALTLSLSSAWVMYVTMIRVSTSVIRVSVSMTTEGAALAAYTNYTEISTTTTLTSGINASTGTVPVASGTLFLNGDYIQIDSEIILISSGGTTNTLTVFRAQSGTTAATHSNGATVTRLIPLNANILKLTGQAAGVGAATNDIVAKMGYVERKGAA